MKTTQWLKLMQMVLAGGLIGGGLWWVHPPAAPLAVGALLWCDLMIGSLGTLVSTSRATGRANS